MLKIRRSCDRLIFNMGIPIPEKDDLYRDGAQGNCGKMLSYQYRDPYVKDKTVSPPSYL